MTADSIVIRRRLTMSLGAHSLLCIPTELTNHVCATLQGQQAEPGVCSLLKNWASDGWFVSFEEPIPLSDTTCLMVTHKNTSQRSFTHSTGVETEFPHCSEGLANECRSLAVTEWQELQQQRFSGRGHNMTGKQNYTWEGWNEMRSY